MRKTLLALAAAAVAIPAAPAAADPPPWAPAHGKRAKDRHYGGYDRYAQPVYNTNQVWRGDDGRYYCRRSNGTTGLVIGAAGGALLGRALDSRGSRTTGTVLGAAAGALLGREVARSGTSCR